MPDTKVWFVTGASSGFGRAITEYALRLGNKVVATLRQPCVLSDLTSRYPATQLLLVRVDVTVPAEIAAAFTQAHAWFGRIDVVFNNAGVLYMSEVESMDEAIARDVFDVNFWGAVRVSTEAVRFFRDVNAPKGGRLLQVSSQLGVEGLATCGFYSASKFALEGLSESLADELDPAWNIKVTILELGPFRTAIFDKNFLVAPQHPAYADPASRCSVLREVLGPQTSDGDVDKAAVVIEKLVHLEHPPIRFPLHRGVVATIRDKAERMMEIVDKYESWSNDLYHDAD